MDTRGIEHVMMLNVDNALAPVLNPHLLGFHQIHGSSLSCMMVQKSHADEKIGTFSTDKKGGLVVVEYSQLTNEQRYLRDDADQLVHRLGSTGVNVASVKGLREVACTYPFIVHAARKRV